MTLICYGFTGFFSFQWSVLLLIFRFFFITSMLTVRWFFLAQFSNFRSLSRRKFAHIFSTHTQTSEETKKKVRSRFYSQMTLMLGIIFFAIECFSTQCDVNQGELEEWQKRKKNRRQPKKNYKKHFNSQTLAFIVDYLNSCNKHPFFIVVLSSLLLDKLETTERTNYKHHNIHSIRWWRWESSKLFFSLFVFTFAVSWFFFSLLWLVWDSLIQYWNFHRILHFYRWNIFIGIHKNYQKCRVFFFSTKFNGFIFFVAFEAQTFCEFFF